MASRFSTIMIIASLLSVITLTVSCRQHRTPKKISFKRTSNSMIQGEAEDSDSLLHSFIPSLLSDFPEQIIRRKAYITSYNKETKLPNWVAWHLTSDHADGVYKRISKYFEDYDVPTPRATDEDYRGSGWTHGHMCPAGDNKWDIKAMEESNILTNICPQDGQLNTGVWNRIEQDCRKWAKRYGDIFIVCGPVLLNVEHETIGNNKIVVPEAFFKVVLCLNPKPKAIGFVIRNNDGSKKRDNYINTIDEVERITGIDFFPSLPDEVENAVESYSDIDDWK